MATYYIDKYATGADDGTSWEDADVDIANLEGFATSSDTVLIKSYGPDDPYTTGRNANIGLYVVEALEGITIAGDDGTGDDNAPSYRMVYIETGGAVAEVYGYPFTARYISATGFVGFQVAASTTSSATTISHCRTGGNTSRAVSVTAGGNVAIEWHESFNDGDEPYVGLAGVTIAVYHCTINQSASRAFAFGANCDDGSIDIRSFLSLNNTAGSFAASIQAQWASTVDYNYTDDGSMASAYDPDLSATPSNDVYTATEADYLPYAAYGILYPTRGFPGARQGHDGMDVGAHSHEYAVECYPTASLIVEVDTPAHDDAPGDAMFVSLAAAINTYRATFDFDIQNIPAGVEVHEAWFAYYLVGNSSTAGAKLEIRAYAGNGTGRDPATDADSAEATVWGYIDDGPLLAADPNVTDSSAAYYSVLLDPDCMNLMLEEARLQGRDNFSVALKMEDETDDEIVLSGHDGTAAQRGRMIVVYRQGQDAEDMLQEALDMLEFAVVKRL